MSVIPRCVTDSRGTTSSPSAMADGRGPAVRLHERDNDVDTLVAQPLALLEHGERLADAGGGAEQHAKPAPTHRP